MISDDFPVSFAVYAEKPVVASTKELEKVVGLQTDKPLKRAFMPYGGIKMAEQACTTYGYQPSEKLHEIFHKYCKTHNDGVFDAYTPEMKLVRHNHILTGLPDTYGRGRIVGDYRRVALYGIDFLIKEKQNDLANMGDREMIDDVIRLREEVSMQIKALINACMIPNPEILGSDYPSLLPAAQYQRRLGYQPLGKRQSWS